LSERAEARLDQFKSKLLDLSLRNKLLNYRPGRSSAVPVVFEVPRVVVDRLIEEDASFGFLPRNGGEEPPADHREFRPVADEELTAGKTDRMLQTSLDRKELEKTLYNLFLKSRTSFEEQGVVSLFLAIGLLSWFESESSDEEHLAPILLLPVTLHRAGVGRPFTLAAAPEEPEVNPSLLRKLEVDFGVKPDLPTLHEGIDPDAILSAFGGILPEPRWKVLSDMHLGLFSFGKYIMYRDLSDQGSTLAENRLVGRLVGDLSESEEPPPPPPDPGDLDGLRHPRDVHQILDADSSQQVAIETVRRGSDLVLEGPPGTGKSQTIANIIAEALALGRTVLFVSEKMAALEVVSKRLAQAGLGDYVLELHSRHANKRAVVSELKRCLERERRGPAEGADDLDRLVAERDRLADYVKALHEPHHGFPPFTAFGALARRAEERDVLVPFDRPEGVGEPTLFRRLRLLSDFARAREDVTPRASHPFRVCRRTAIPRVVAIELEKRLGSLRDRADALASLVENECDALSIDVAPEFAGTGRLIELLAHLARSPRPEPAWVTNRRWRGVTGDGRTLAARGRRHAAGTERLSKVWTDDLFDLALEEIATRRKRQGTSFFRFLTESFWRDRKTLGAVRRPGARRSTLDTIEDLELAVAIRDLGGEIDGAGAWAAEAFGRLFAGRETDWEKLDGMCAWVGELAELAGGDETPAAVAEVAANPVGAADRATALRQALDAVRAELAELRELLSAREGPADGAEALVTWAETAIERREEIHDWAAYRRSLDACREEDLQGYLDAADRENLTAGELAPGYEKAFFTAWLDRALAARPILRDFDGTEHEATIARFRELDRRQMPLAAERIRARLDDEMPSSMSFSPDSDVGLLLREAAKKRRHLPIRQLLRRAGVAIRRLKPCFMMSPISVAQFLPPDSEPFDLIVFDEASQICPEDAIGALARGSLMVVVGDSRQLPPTSFFSYDPDYEPPEEEEPLPDLESILDLCAAQGFPRLRLRWHYRSRDESLISFSNENFYEGTLLTFPGPGRRPGTGLSLRHVPDGVYDRGKSRTNRIEAARVARGIAEQALLSPGTSIGVVTFGEPQRRAVLEAVERLMAEEPGLERMLATRDADEPFFVKNLENVQGDERDVMFFSVGYARDGEGRLHMNFGPLSGDGGHRRLNVAVTRARYATIVYSSILPEDIDLERAKAKGARLLRLYLEKARDAGMGRGAAVDAESVADLPALARAVAGEFVKRGYGIVPRIGSSAYRIDLAVSGPEAGDGFLLGIESDGPVYRDAATVRDRDRTRGEVLAGLGWKLERVWSTDYSRAPEREVERLVDALVATGPATPAKPLAFEPTKKRKRKSRRGDGLPAAAPYRITPPSKRRPRKPFDADSPELPRMVTAIVAHEGPVHEDDVARRVADTFDLRLTASVREAVARAIDAVVAEGKAGRRGEFLWPPEMVVAAIRGPADGAGPRPVERVPDEEIESGLRMVLAVDLRMPLEALVTAVARILGHRRPRREVRERIAGVVARLTTAGELRRGEDHVSLEEE